MGHILRLLRERESALCNPNWVLNEAMSRRSLQHGGTFKNVLARKIDDVTVPIFAEIIAFLDHNCNLSLLQTGSETTPLSQFWLRMFQSPRAEQQLHYEQMVGRQKVPMAEEEIESQFPFSWLVKEAVDSQWDEAKRTAGNLMLYVASGTLMSISPLLGFLSMCMYMFITLSPFYNHILVSIPYPCFIQ